MNSSDSHQNFEKARCLKLKLITRSRETEKYRDKDEENKAKSEGTLLMDKAKLLRSRKSPRTSIPESKVMLQDITRKRKDVNCVEKKTLSWNTDLIETMKLENLICQAAQVEMPQLQSIDEVVEVLEPLREAGRGSSPPMSEAR